MPTQLNKHREAKRFELDIADDLDARRVFLSGAGMEKADVRKRASYQYFDGMVQLKLGLTFRVEAKTTQREYYEFRAVDWADLVRAADAAAEAPVFAVRFLRQRISIVLARVAFIKELKLVCCEPKLTMAKSIRLRPGLFPTIEVPRINRPSDHVAVGDYFTFIGAVQKYHAQQAAERDAPVSS